MNGERREMMIREREEEEIERKGRGRNSGNDGRGGRALLMPFIISIDNAPYYSSY